MPRDSNGNMTLPVGNPVQPQQTIGVDWANPTMDDLAAEIQDSLSRSGKGAMLAALKMLDAGAVFDNEQNSGLYRAGAGDVRLKVLGIDSLFLASQGVDAARMNGIRIGKVSRDTSLANLIAGIGATVTHLVLYPEAWPVLDDLTIPSNITLECPREVDIQIASGKTLTIPVPTAGEYPIFSGDGTVLFTGDGECELAWFDITGSTIDTALSKMFASGGEAFHVGSGTFYVANSTTLPRDLDVLTLRGNGMHATSIELNNSTPGNRIFRGGIDSGGSYTQYTMGNPASDTYSIADASAGDTTITCDTAADAGNFSAGDWIYIRANQNSGDPGGEGEPANFEFNKIVSADDGTGVITLQVPLRRDYDSTDGAPYEPECVSLAGMPKNVTFKDLALGCGTTGSIGGQWINLRIERVLCRGRVGSNYSTLVNIGSSYNPTIESCWFEYGSVGGAPISAGQGVVNMNILNNHAFIGVNQFATLEEQMWGTIIRGNTIIGGSNGQYLIIFPQIGTEDAIVTNNIFDGAGSGARGINFSGVGSGLVCANNVFKSLSQDYSVPAGVVGVVGPNFSTQSGTFELFDFGLFPKWNSLTTKFEALQIDVTDTTSNAASLLMHLKVGGVSILKIYKDGRIEAPSLSSASPGSGFIWYDPADSNRLKYTP